MRKHIINGILLISVIILVQCTPEKQPIFEPDNRIILTNPGLWDLKAVLFLIEEDIIKLTNTELQVVYFDNFHRDFEKCSAFATEKELNFITFEKVYGELNPENLFEENDCSDDFYNLFKASDGILFFGGADFPPETYNQKTSLLTSIVTPQRHYFELSFLFHLLGGSQNSEHKAYLDEKPDYLVYGFCLGMQTMNAATGGSMFQDIPKYIYGLEYVEDVLAADRDQMHRNYWARLAKVENIYWRNLHPIQMIADGFFINNMKISLEDRPIVCSNHHQAVDQVGQGLQVEALSTDGKVIEALSHERFKNVLGVQFHPEVPTLYQQDGPRYFASPDDSVGFREYDKLVEMNSLEFHLKFWKYFSSLVKN